MSVDSTMEKQSEQGSTLIAVLNSMKASIGSRNGLLRELSHKRSSPDDETRTSKRRTQCPQTASDEDENRRRQNLTRPDQKGKQREKREKKSNKIKSFIR